ncbi:hypothetical protein M493_15180 [Geobacillus genomosp. 3]|uniref:Uncharacterized protein n=1 Tax=Geobacillus genomosp. 3 TaxID=1921421 RepID=S5Z8W0_GEOG3|nr:hypothetical protein M493_15180 [Geobacillus genomosp. 3]
MAEKRTGQKRIAALRARKDRGRTGGASPERTGLALYFYRMSERERKGVIP